MNDATRILPAAPLDPRTLPALREALAASYGGRWCASAETERLAVAHGLATHGGRGIGWTTTEAGSALLRGHCR